MNKTELQAAIDAAQAKIVALDAQIKPLEAKRGRLYKEIGKHQEEIANLSLQENNFVALLKDPAACDQMRTYCIAFMGSEHEYQGVRNEGFIWTKDWSRPIRWNFKLHVRTEEDRARAERFITEHLQYLELTEGGWDRPFVYFSYASESWGLSWAAWDGTDWYDVEFRYGSVREARQVKDLKEMLDIAHHRQRREDDD